MTIDDLVGTTGEWLRGEGQMSDVVVSSRVRLARNLAERPFLATASASERTEIYRCVADAVTSTSATKDALLIDVDAADELDREILVERHLISRQQVAAQGSRGVTVSADETRALMINEEDHLRIQGLRSGLELTTIWDDVNEVDDALSQELPFAFERDLGYLTACPTNVGTGLRVSVMLHLPALGLTKEIERVARAARDMHLAVRGTHGEGTEAAGDLYQVSNQTTLGRSEREIVDLFCATIIPKVVEYERAARDTLLLKSAASLDDRIWRAYGALCNARTITSDETHNHLSPLRMGIQMGRFDKFGIHTLNELFLMTQPAHLQKLHGRILEGEERDVLRADYIREKLDKAASN